MPVPKPKARINRLPKGERKEKRGRRHDIPSERSVAFAKGIEDFMPKFKRKDVKPLF